MRKRIEQIVMDSFGDQFYEKALECLKCLREQCIKVGHLLLCSHSPNNVTIKPQGTMYKGRSLVVVFPFS